MEWMQLMGYTDEEFQEPVQKDPYTFMLNPDSLKWTRSIEYNEQQAPGTSSPSQKFKSIPSDVLRFEIVIDCTGIVNARRIDMATEIKMLEKIVFTFNGQIHRPNFVSLHWGKNMTFKGVLKSFETSYTLFRPDGSPLRARIQLEFGLYISPVTVGKIDNQSSPDITHMVDVVEGVSLPQMCDKIWKDESMYVQVARFNDLNKFRNLSGIQKLVFPPIIQPV